MSVFYWMYCHSPKPAREPVLENPWNIEINTYLVGFSGGFGWVFWGVFLVAFIFLNLGSWINYYNTLFKCHLKVPSNTNPNTAQQVHPVHNDLTNCTEFTWGQAPGQNLFSIAILCSHGFPKKPGTEGTHWEDPVRDISRADCNLIVTKQQLQAFGHICVPGSCWFQGTDSVHVKPEVVQNLAFWFVQLLFQCLSCI